MCTPGAQRTVLTPAMDIVARRAELVAGVKERSQARPLCGPAAPLRELRVSASRVWTRSVDSIAWRHLGRSPAGVRTMRTPRIVTICY